MAVTPSMRGRLAQTGSERGMIRYGAPHPVFGDALLFEGYRVFPNGNLGERWLTPRRFKERSKERAEACKKCAKTASF